MFPIKSSGPIPRHRETLRCVNAVLYSKARNYLVEPEDMRLVVLESILLAHEVVWGHRARAKSS